MNKESVASRHLHKFETEKKVRRERGREKILYHVNNMRLGLSMMGKKK